MTAYELFMDIAMKEMKNTSAKDKKFLYSILLAVLVAHLGMLMCILL